MNQDNPPLQTRLDSPEAPKGALRTTRRRLLTGAVAGSGVYLAIHAKTALGTTVCQSPSAMISGNTSPRPGDGHVCSGGRSPGFWKQPQHFGYWALIPPTFSVSVSTCMTGLGNLSPCDISNIGTAINSVFPGAPGGDKGIWEVIAWPENYPTVDRSNGQCTISKQKSGADAFGGQGQLLRHLSCAYLNASFFGSSSQDYPLSTNQVIEMWNAVKGGGEYCPSGMTCPQGKGMSAQEIIDYISSLYDINSDIEGDVCKKN